MKKRILQKSLRFLSRYQKWNKKNFAQNFVARIWIKFFMQTFFDMGNKKCQVKNFDLLVKNWTLFSKANLKIPDSQQCAQLWKNWVHGFSWFWWHNIWHRSQYWEIIWRDLPQTGPKLPKYGHGTSLKWLKMLFFLIPQMKVPLMPSTHGQLEENRYWGRLLNWSPL